MFGELAAAGLGAGLSFLQNHLSSVGSWAKAQNRMSMDNLQKSMAMQLNSQKLYDSFKSNLDYDYAKRYAQNSVKWQMEGLKNADLNPILAVTNGSMAGTFGSPSSGSVGSGSSPRSSGRTSSDIALAASQMAATARQNALVDEQIKQVQAQTRNINQDTANKAATNGLTGTPAALSVLANKLGLSGNSAKSDSLPKPLVYVEKVANSVSHSARSNRRFAANGFESFMRDLGQYLRSGGPFGNAKTRMEVVRQDMDRYYNAQF